MVEGKLVWYRLAGYPSWPCLSFSDWKSLQDHEYVLGHVPKKLAPGRCVILFMDAFNVSDDVSSKTKDYLEHFEEFGGKKAGKKMKKAYAGQIKHAMDNMNMILDATRDLREDQVEERREIIAECLKTLTSNKKKKVVASKPKVKSEPKSKRMEINENDEEKDIYEISTVEMDALVKNFAMDENLWLRILNKLGFCDRKLNGSSSILSLRFMKECLRVAVKHCKVAPAILEINNCVNANGVKKDRCTRIGLLRCCAVKLLTKYVTGFPFVLSDVEMEGYQKFYDTVSMGEADKCTSRRRGSVRKVPYEMLKSTNEPFTILCENTVQQRLNVVDKMVVEEVRKDPYQDSFSSKKRPSEGTSTNTYSKRIRAASMSKKNPMEVQTNNVTSRSLTRQKTMQILPGIFDGILKNGNSWDPFIFRDVNTTDLAKDTGSHGKRSRTTGFTNLPERPREIKALKEHTLVKCQNYEFGLESPMQPFVVKVNPDASSFIDFHCRCATSEVYGILGGKWDKKNKILYIQCAIPCKAVSASITQDDTAIHPASLKASMEALDTNGLQHVGNYHSHPYLSSSLSHYDLENQLAAQNAVKGLPFIGLIVGTVHSTGQAKFEYHHVLEVEKHKKGKVPFPMHLDVIDQIRHSQNYSYGEVSYTDNVYPNVWANLGYKSTSVKEIPVTTSKDQLSRIYERCDARIRPLIELSVVFLQYYAKFPRRVDATNSTVMRAFTRGLKFWLARSMASNNQAETLAHDLAIFIELKWSEAEPKEPSETPTKKSINIAPRKKPSKAIEAISKTQKTPKPKKRGRQLSDAIELGISDDDNEVLETPKSKMNSINLSPKKRDPASGTPLASIWTSRASQFPNHPLVSDDNIFEDIVIPSPVKSPVQDNRKTGRRRKSSKHTHGNNILEGAMDPHTMIKCDDYNSDPEFLQPYTLKVHPEVAFVCDLHAHLAECEIIGFLAGTWDPVNRVVHIQAAYPCRSVDSDLHDGSMDVEMDPGSEIELREIIARQNLQVIGWYHSHPQFQPDPSVRDIENQMNYQLLFKDTIHDIEPFVGLIVGTYDIKNTTPQSVFRYFHVTGQDEKCANKSYPMELKALTRKYRETNNTPQPHPWHGRYMYTGVYHQLSFCKVPLIHNVLPSSKASGTKPSFMNGLTFVSPMVASLKLSEAMSKRLAFTSILLKSTSKEVLSRLRHHHPASAQCLIEQCISLIDYYSEFDRKVDLTQKWKNSTKLQKIKASLLSRVSNLSMSADVASLIVKDLIEYIKCTWNLSVNAYIVEKRKLNEALSPLVDPSQAHLIVKSAPSYIVS